MSARTNRWLVAAAIAAVFLGATLSRVIEPGVRVEKIMLTTNTPALRLFPATPGPHPVALLAHPRNVRSGPREGGCQSRVRYCWQTSARCSDRVAVAIRRACAGNSGRTGPDVSPA